MTKKVLFLWSPLADYSLACMRELANKPNIELSIVYQAAEIDAPYNHLDISFFRRAIAYQQDNEREIESYCFELRPDTILMASWNYPFYMKISRASRARGSYVVSVFDRQWLGTTKQWLGILTASVFLKPSIDNFFVAGDRQAAFARKLGYNNPYQGYYCANTHRFESIVVHPNRNFIFVGRLVSVKGVDSLINAYAQYRASVSDPWNLLLCGKGELEAQCHNQPGIQVLGFMQPDELPAHLANATCLILPSHFEPWGLVVHEAVTAGLAIIASHHVGATTYFVRDGQNGYIINPDEASLLRAMRQISQAENSRLISMQQISRELAGLWTVSKWADYVYGNVCTRSS
jgi:glycosyltransferase involved in cell wall biosynthesis